MQKIHLEYDIFISSIHFWVIDKFDVAFCYDMWLVPMKKNW